MLLVTLALLAAGQSTAPDAPVWYGYPYSIWYHYTVTDEDGSVTPGDDTFVGSNAAGDLVRTYNSRPLKYLNLASGLRITLDPARRLKCTRGVLFGRAPRLDNHKCLAQAQDRGFQVTNESSVILGFTAYKFRDTTSRASTYDRKTGKAEDMQTVLDQWLAPELDCQPLLEVSTLTDPTTGKTSSYTMQATWAKREAPPDSEFKVPADYTEVPPSVISPPPPCNADARCAECAASRVAHDDQQYYRQKEMRENRPPRRLPSSPAPAVE